MDKICVYNDIFLSKGYLRSILFDTSRVKIHFVDRNTAEFLNSYKVISKSDLAPFFLDMLIDNDLVFDPYHYNIDCFPLMALEWDFSFLVSNFVIEMSPKVVFELSKFKPFHFVSHFNIVLEELHSKRDINRIFSFLRKQPCDSIELTFLKPLSQSILFEIKRELKNLKKIVKILNYAGMNFDDVLCNNHRYSLSLDNINLKLSKNIDHYLEAQNYHTYFNRKLFLSKKGEIKNAKEAKKCFGNISDISDVEQIIELVKSKPFQNLWKIKKDKTDVCKDCEFRHICLDNRLPNKRKGYEWYHKIECTYNPYIAKWKDEEGFRTLSECGVTSDENGFSIDHEKIAKINEELWGKE